VVHRQHRVAAGKYRRGEHGVGRVRPGEQQTARAQALQRRADDLDFLAAEIAALASVRIEAGDQDARCSQAVLAAQVMGDDRQRLFQQLAGDRLGHRA